MYVHVDPKIFEQRPFLGVLLGLVGLCFGIFVLYFEAREYFVFRGAPQVVQADQVTPPPGDDNDPGRWVTLRGRLQLDCIGIVQWRNTLPESLIFGQVQSTLIAATDVTRQRLFVLQFDGEESCSDAQKAPLTGELTGIGRGRLRSLQQQGMYIPATKYVMKLCLSCTPKQTKLFLIFGVIFSVMCSWLMVRYWLRYQEMSTQKETYIPSLPYKP